MVSVVIPLFVAAFQLEVTADVERSNKGAIYVRPGTLELTSGEAELVLAAVPGSYKLEAAPVVFEHKEVIADGDDVPLDLGTPVAFAPLVDELVDVTSTPAAKAKKKP